MIPRILCLLILLLASVYTHAQTRTIQLRVIDEDLEVLIGYEIYDQNSHSLGNLDKDGMLQLAVPEKADTLILKALGMENTTIIIPKDCDYLEVILLTYWKYKYSSHRKIDRKRKKQFNTLDKLHAKARVQGIFQFDAPCYKRIFIPRKPALDKIRKEMDQLDEELDQCFAALTIGDTVYVPCCFAHNKNVSTCYYSIYAFKEKKSYDCLLKGIVRGRNDRNYMYNVLFEVISLDHCSYELIMFGGKEVEIGDVFEYNMRNFKIFIQKQ